MSSDPTPPVWLREALENARDEVEHIIGRPLTGKEINDGHCRLFAQLVLNQCSTNEITIHSYGLEHTWIEYDNAYYDAERIQYGATTIEDLPFFNHPDVTISWNKVQEGFPETTHNDDLLD